LERGLIDLKYGVIINIPGDKVKAIGPWRKGELMSPSEAMDQIRLVFPNATLGEDADGQVIINTDMKIVNEEEEKLVPFEVKS
jgi:hypothetical protein